MKILFSNLGYARGIDGSLWHHVSRIGRHFYCPAGPQQAVLSQLKGIVDRETPDLCCFVEIDKGGFFSGHYNQMEALKDQTYRHHHIANKYGESFLSKLPFHASKCNGFLSKEDFTFETLYFTSGRKRLFYRLSLPNEVALYFAHFSLTSAVRQKQFAELEMKILHDGRPSIVLADFNIFDGFSEIENLLSATGMKLLNRDDEFTHTFHTKQSILDLCLASTNLAPHITLKIIPQPYSDHAALFIELKGAL